MVLGIKLHQLYTTKIIHNYKSSSFRTNHASPLFLYYYTLISFHLALLAFGILSFYAENQDYRPQKLIYSSSKMQ
jgi:hypothetical protein